MGCSYVQMGCTCTVQLSKHGMQRREDCVYCTAYCSWNEAWSMIYKSIVRSPVKVLIFKKIREVKKVKSKIKNFQNCHKFIHKIWIQTLAHPAPQLLRSFAIVHLFFKYLAVFHNAYIVQQSVQQTFIVLVSFLEQMRQVVGTILCSNFNSIRLANLSKMLCLPPSWHTSFLIGKSRH